MRKISIMLATAVVLFVATMCAVGWSTVDPTTAPAVTMPPVGTVSGPIVPVTQDLWPYTMAQPSVTDGGGTGVSFTVVYPVPRAALLP